LPAIEWAAGGRGQPLVDAAAQALAAGLESPTTGGHDALDVFTFLGFGGQ